MIRTFSRRTDRKGKIPLVVPDPYDPSFPLARTGIDSLLLAELVMDLETAFQVELPFSRLCNTRTIGDFVELVCRGRA